MSYEQFRHSLLTRITDINIPPEVLNRIMEQVDFTAQDYRIERASTDIIAYDNGIPEILKIYIASLAIQNCSKRTLSLYKNELIHFLQYTRKPYTTITSNDIRSYIGNGQITRNWQPSYAEHIRTVINGFFGWLCDNEYINRNPARVIKPLKIPKKKLPAMQQIELECFRNACETDRERALVDFLYSTGARISETANVLLSDIDWKERSVHIRHGKGDKERYTYFNAEAELSMKRYINSRKGNSEYLFCTTRSPYHGVTRESLEHIIKAIRERIPDQLSFKVTPHTFRRTMGTSAVSRGCPIEKVKELLGHESIDTTMQYVNIEQTEVKSAHTKYLAG